MLALSDEILSMAICHEFISVYNFESGTEFGYKSGRFYVGYPCSNMFQ